MVHLTFQSREIGSFSKSLVLARIGIHKPTRFLSSKYKPREKNNRKIIVGSKRCDKISASIEKDKRETLTPRCATNDTSTAVCWPCVWLTREWAALLYRIRIDSAYDQDCLLNTCRCASPLLCLVWWDRRRRTFHPPGSLAANVSHC